MRPSQKTRRCGAQPKKSAAMRRAAKKKRRDAALERVSEKQPGEPANLDAELTTRRLSEP
jgi:hypothetical protein